MDRDQEKFYEDEQESTDQSAGIQENSKDTVDDMSFFISLIKAIRETINMGHKIPFSSKWIVDAEKCIAILNDMQDNLPEAIQYGWQMYSERERIMGEAERHAMNRVTSAEISASTAIEESKKEAGRMINDANDEAEAILKDAQLRADKLVSDDEIVQRAREEARIIVNEAKVEAGEIRLAATHEALQTVTSVEDDLAEALNAIRRSRKQLEEESK